MIKIILPLLIGFFVFAGTGSGSFEERKKGEKQQNKEKEEIKVFNASKDQELASYNSLELDKTHSNLLDARHSESGYEKVLESWTELHQGIGNFLSANEFDWEVEDPSIAIVHKVYFEENGEIKAYFFNVLNKSVSMEKQEEYAGLIKEFAGATKIGLTREKDFAQCGKTRYMNK